MLGSVVMRSYSIWIKALASQSRDESLKEKLREQRKILPENTEKQE